MTLSLRRRLETLERRTRTRPEAVGAVANLRAMVAARREVLLMLSDPEACRLACKVDADGGDREAAITAFDTRMTELMERGGT